MVVIRVLGLVLAIFALMIMGADILRSIGEGAMTMRAAGELWFALHAPSLNALQAGIERHLTPALWDPVIVTVLLWPAFAVVGVPALILLIWGYWPWKREKRIFAKN